MDDSSKVSERKETRCDIDDVSNNENSSVGTACHEASDQLKWKISETWNTHKCAQSYQWLLRINICVPFSASFSIFFVFPRKISRWRRHWTTTKWQPDNKYDDSYSDDERSNQRVFVTMTFALRWYIRSLLTPSQPPSSPHIVDCQWIGCLQFAIWTSKEMPGHRLKRRAIQAIQSQIANDAIDIDKEKTL